MLLDLISLVKYDSPVLVTKHEETDVFKNITISFQVSFNLFIRSMR